MPSALNDLTAILGCLERETFVRQEGRVVEVTGMMVKSIGPRVSIGDMAWIETGDRESPKRLPCEVVGFRDDHVLMMPVERLEGVHPGERVLCGERMSVSAGYGLLGRVVDGLGRPLDGTPLPPGLVPVEIEKSAPHPMLRQSLSEPFITGVRAIDGLLTTAKGQRVGIFAGSGVGKSVLLGSLARNSSATVNVIALVGERGREVRDFVEKSLGPEGLKKSVVVAVTSDQSPVLRIKGAATAMAIAEYFRDAGENVLFLIDSVTRCAMAQREIGLSVGEPPTTKGYPPSVFGLLTRLLERSGSSDKGSITAFCTVLVEADDMNDPIADSVRAILDGHIVLSRRLASLNHFPSIDVPSSVSRLMNDIVTRPHLDLAIKMKSLMSVYARAEDMVNIGAYVAGSNPRIDEALRKIDKINEFLKQAHDSTVAIDATMQAMKKALE